MKIYIGYKNFVSELLNSKGLKKTRKELDSTSKIYAIIINTLLLNFKVFQIPLVFNHPKS